MEKPDYIYAAIIAIALLAVRAIALNFPGHRLWGIDIFAYLPRIVSYVYLALLTALILLSASDKRLTFNGVNGSRKKFQSIVYALLFVMGMLALFRLFTDSANLLGDGPLRIQEMEKKGLHRFFIDAVSEPLDYAIHYLSYKHIFKPLGMNAVDCFRFWSYLAGLIYLVAVWNLSQMLKKFGAENWLTFCYMFGWGGVMMFFGYAENYALAASILLLSINQLLVFAETGKRLTIGLLLFLLAFFMHNLAVVFLPFILYLAKDQLLFKKPLRESLPPFIATTIAIGYMIFAQLNKEKSDLLISGNKSDPEYFIFGFAHFADIGNLVLLVLPVALLLLGYQKLTTSDDNLRRLRIGFWLSALCGIVLVFLIDPRLGMARDWDLFSLLLLTVHLSLFFGVDWLNRSRGFKIIVVVISIGLVLPWIVLNSNLSASRERFWNIAALDSGRAWYNYEVLGEHYYYAGDLAMAEKAYAHSVTYKDHPRPFLWLGFVQMEQGKYREAEANFKETLRLKPEDVFALNYLSILYSRQGRYLEAKECLEKYAATPKGRNDKTVIPAIHLLDSLITAQADSAAN